MCEWGTSVRVRLCRPRTNSIGQLHDVVEVDACIAPLVQALNDAGIETVASCCGHKRKIGNVALRDGRELIIAADFETARQVDKLVGMEVGGKKTRSPSLAEHMEGQLQEDRRQAFRGVEVGRG